MDCQGRRGSLLCVCVVPFCDTEEGGCLPKGSSVLPSEGVRINCQGREWRRHWLPFKYQYDIGYLYFLNAFVRLPKGTVNLKTLRTCILLMWCSPRCLPIVPGAHINSCVPWRGGTKDTVITTSRSFEFCLYDDDDSEACRRYWKSLRTLLVCVYRGSSL